MVEALAPFYTRPCLDLVFSLETGNGSNARPVRILNGTSLPCLLPFSVAAKSNQVSRTVPEQ